MQKFKKLLSAVIAACLVASISMTTSLAASNFTYTMPKEPVNVSGSSTVLTTLTQRAASEIPLIFGINVLGGNMFPGLQYVGGTVVNENPDPYIWNFNYMYPNYQRMTEPGEVEAGRQTLPEGTFYKYLGNSALNDGNGLYNSGGANQNYSQAVDELGGIGYAVGYRSDVIIGFNSVTVDQIDLVRSWKSGDEYYQKGDETYNPLIIDVQTGSVTSRLYSWAEMGQAISAYLAEHPSLTTRYEDPYTIAVNLEEFSAGIPYYIASLIANGTIEKKTAAYVSAIDLYTLTCVDPGTLGNVSADVYAEVHNFDFVTGNYTLADLMKQGVDLIILGASGYGYTSNASSMVGGGQGTTGSSKQDILRALAQLGYSADKMPLVMDQNTINVTIGTNGYNYAPTTCLFLPYVQSYAYMDELAKVNSAINPVAMVQYMLDEFCHVEDSSAADVALYYIGTYWDSVDEDYDRVPDLANYKYDKAAIAKAIQTGISYALSSQAAANGNTLLPAYRANDNAYLLLTQHTTSTKPASSHDYITLTVGGQTKYLDLTVLAATEGEVAADMIDAGADGVSEYQVDRTEYQAIIDYYNSGKYGYGDDLQTTLQKYADHMVSHVWTPDTSVKNTYGYGLSAAAAPAVKVNPFSDVASTSPFYNAILWAVDEGITNGVTETTFQPGTTCSRAQIVTFLWRAAGRPEPASSESPYSDVVEGSINSDFYKAILWAAEKGIAEEGDTFSPNDPCTRSTTVTFLWKYAGSPKASAASSFTDVAASADYAQAVAWAVEQKITTGVTTTTFEPGTICSRGQIVTFLYRDLV